VRICIYGAGAIGGYLAAGLSTVGEVELSLVARGAHLEKIQQDGLKLLIDGQEKIHRASATDDPATLGPQDYVIIGLKAHQAWETAVQTRPLLDPHTAAVCQNGVPWWYGYGLTGFDGLRLRSVDPGDRQWKEIGPERAIGGVVYPATDMPAPGVARHIYGNTFPLGEPDGTISERCRALARVFEQAGFDAPVLRDIRSELWLKLWGALCFNPISVLTRALLDVVATEPALRALSEQMMSKVKDIAVRFGVAFRIKIEGRINGAARVGAHRTSMLQDLESGRPLEIDALLTAVQEMGRLVGVKRPYIDTVLGLVQQLGRSLTLYPAFPLETAAVAQRPLLAGI
jgi:2-dehydropantoate 2-reductase